MMTTLNKMASEQSLRKYNVLRNFSIGQIDIPVEVGDVLEYTRGKLVIYGQEYKVTNLEDAIKAGWLELAEGQEADPIVNRLIGIKTVKKETTVPEPEKTEVQSSDKVETVNGVETLPDEWESLHWTKKRAYIINMTDATLLKDIMEDESDKIKSIIQKHLDTLGETSVAVARVSMKKTNTGTPEKTKVLKAAVATDDYTPTSFGPTQKKSIVVSSEKFDSTVMEDPNAEVAKIK